MMQTFTKPVSNTMTWIIAMLVAMFSASSFAQTSLQEELNAKKTANAGKMSAITRLSTGTSLIQRDPTNLGRSSSASVSLRYHLTESLNLNLSQGVSYTPEDTTAVKTEEHDNLQIGATSLKATQKLGSLNDLIFSATVGGALYHSDFYKDITRTANANASATMVWTPVTWFTYSLTPGYTQYFHQETFNRLDSGTANAIYAATISQSAIFTTSYVSGLSLTLSVTNYEIDYYEDRETAYLYGTDATLAYQATDRINVNVGVGNLYNQIENERIMPIKIIDKDLTIVSAGASVKVL